MELLCFYWDFKEENAKNVNALISENGFETLKLVKLVAFVRGEKLYNHPMLYYCTKFILIKNYIVTLFYKIFFIAIDTLL